jgi:hypothetical protein
MNRFATAALAGILFGLGCASASHDADSERPSSAVRVIKPEQIGSREYDIIEVLEDSEMVAEASRASVEARVTVRLQRQAAKLGADALIVTCTSTRGSVMSCRGIAVRWKDDGLATTAD